MRTGATGLLPPVEPAKHDSSPVAAAGSAAGRQYAGENGGGCEGKGVSEGVAVLLAEVAAEEDADPPALTS